MRQLNATKFKEQCLSLLDNLDSDGVVITKRGKPRIRTLDFAADPADEIIAATSLVHGVPLVTRDRPIHRSRLVPFT